MESAHTVVQACARCDLEWDTGVATPTVRLMIYRFGGVQMREAWLTFCSEKCAAEWISEATAWPGQGPDASLR